MNGAAAPADTAILVGRSVLVVEDDALIAMVLEDVLAEAGMRLAGSAQSVDEALAQLADRQPDMAVLDASLDGQTCDKVADMLQLRGVPFILATGHAEADMQARFPGVPILRKPYHQDELLSALVTLLIAPDGSSHR